MKQNYILKLSLILIWFYFFTYFQFANQFSLDLTLFFILCYLLFYSELFYYRIPSDYKNYILFFCFASAFAVFWSKIITLLLYYADLYQKKDPLIIIFSSAFYFILFVLFYYKLPRKKKQTDQIYARKPLQLLLNISFPITTSIVLFLAGLSLFALLLRYQLLENSGVTLLSSVFCQTVLYTVLLTLFFEKWLQLASEEAIKRAFFIETIVGVILVVLLILGNR